jgi:Erythromycin biosynthesis protein CIII-like, C-terminal domain/Erythromycin biosynthesis protein CIII-like, N-terminal domain
VRVLFASTQGAGHFGPLIPYIDACTRNGHETLIVGPPTLKARGYPFRPGDVPPEEILGPLWGRIASLPPARGDMVVVGVIFARLNVDAMLPTLTQTIEEWQPDLVVRESAEYASAIAAEMNGVTHVRVSTGVALIEEASLAIAAPALDGRRPGISERIAASPYLTSFPGSVDPAPFDVIRLRHPATERKPEPLPGWWPDDDRPVVYMSFGSVAATFPPAAQAYASAVAAAANLPARVLLTTGGHEIELGELPPNLQVESWVDEAAVLAHASAAVGHGGAGTTLCVLAAGVPLVSVPLFGDQPYNATRVAVAGAGLVTHLDGIRDAVELVLADTSYRDVARRAADEMRSLPPVDEFLAPYE